MIDYDIIFLLIKKSKVLLTEKYDISQKIFKELVNLESRYILFSIMKHPKSIQDIAKEQKIPTSTAYKKMASLEKCALIHVKNEIPDDGHITKYYQSKIKDVEISISKFEPTIRFSKNNLVKK